jgi:hypothetical protein
LHNWAALRRYRRGRPMESEAILMAKSRLLEDDRVARVRDMFHASTDGDTFITEKVQDVTEIVGANKTLYNAHDERTPFAKDIERVASIPVVVWERLKREGIADDRKALLRWLDDPDNRAFRTRPGRLS